MENTAVDILTERKNLTIASTEKIINGLKAQLDLLKDLALRDIAEAENNDQLMDFLFRSAKSLMKINLAIEEGF